MPGPGPHLMYAMSSGLALTHLTKGRFSPHHTLAYTLNAFFGPDIGSFAEWLSSVLFIESSVLSSLADAIHHPFYYVLILGVPLCVLYSWASSILVQNRLLDSVSGVSCVNFDSLLFGKIERYCFFYVLILGFPLCVLYSWALNLLMQKRLLDSVSGVALTRKQCLMLISAGSLSHFFLDHLFEENGKTTMYTWILSTGWWIGRAPVNPDAVVVVGFLCTCLLCGFIFINRVGPAKFTRKQSYQSMKLIMIIATFYSLWCASQIYWANPRRAAVGEEADLGVLVFLATYFILPHGLCILSMNSEDLHEMV